MDKIILAHGSGGQRTDELIKKLVLKYFKSKHLSHLPDAAKLDVKKKIAFTTDSFVVNPLFFPGGDIGKLAVCGTVNDLLTQAARPRFLSCGVILEEGLPLDDLEKIFSSMDREAKQAGIEIVTGDIKVVEKGKADRIYLNSSGIGEIIADVGFEKIKKGDAVIVTGGIGEHEIAVYMARMKEKGVLSDCASLTSVVLPLIEKFGGSIHFMRDPTRGGLAGVVLEIAETARTDITINEGSVPVRKEVRVTCELMGFDPLYLANEGKMVIVAAESAAGSILDFFKKKKLSRLASIIGRIGSPSRKPEVNLRTKIGGMRRIEKLSGEQLPRIC